MFWSSIEKAICKVKMLILSTVYYIKYYYIVDLNLVKHTLDLT